MRTTIFLLTLLLIGCNSKTTDSDVELLKIDSSLIREFERNDHFDPDRTDLEFKKVTEYLVDLDANNKPDKIELFNIVGWEGDPGDFRQILITLDNGSTWRETNFSGWVKFNANYTINDQVKSQNTLDSNLLLLTEFNGTKLLGMFGWVYASDPGLLTFVEFSSGKPRILVNKNLDLEVIGSDSFVVFDGVTRCSVSVRESSVVKQCE